jgi:hypothetical protein
MGDLKKLDQLNKPGQNQHEDNNSWKTNPPLNKSNPEFAKPEKIAKTILATGGLKPKLGGKTTPAAKTIDEKTLNLAKHRKIKLYLQKFPKLEESGIRLPHLNASTAELDETLFDIHRILNTQSIEDKIPFFVHTAYGLSESANTIYGFNPLGMDFNNLQSLAANPKNIKDLVDALTEIYIEYEEWFSMGPWARVVAEVVKHHVAINEYNKTRNNIISEEVMKKMEEEMMTKGEKKDEQ